MCISFSADACITQQQISTHQSIASWQISLFIIAAPHSALNLLIPFTFDISVLFTNSWGCLHACHCECGCWSFQLWPDPGFTAFLRLSARLVCSTVCTYILVHCVFSTTYKTYTHTHITHATCWRSARVHDKCRFSVQTQAAHFTTCAAVSCIVAYMLASRAVCVIVVVRHPFSRIS